MRVYSVCTACSPSYVAFEEFVKLLETKKEQSGQTGEDTDTLEAWIALGGKADRTGKIAVEHFQRLIEDHGMALNVEQILVAKIEARMKASIMSRANGPRTIVAPKEIEFDTYSEICSIDEPLFGEE